MAWVWLIALLGCGHGDVSFSGNSQIRLCNRDYDIMAADESTIVRKCATGLICRIFIYAISIGYGILLEMSKIFSCHTTVKSIKIRATV